MVKQTTSHNRVADTTRIIQCIEREENRFHIPYVVVPFEGY